MRTAVFILASIFLIAGCSPGRGQQGEQLLDLQAFEKKLETAPDRILLDVRTAQEYRQGHFPNATLIDVTRPDFREKANKLDKSAPVFVYCASGIRSERAVTVLNNLGFQEVYELEGGFNEWARAGKPFVRD